MRKIRSKLKEIKNIEYIVLFVIVLLGFFVRLYKIGTPLADWHSWRQVDTASVSRIYVDNGVNLLYPRYYDISTIQTGLFNPQGYRFVEFPIYNAVHALLVKHFGFFSLEIWGRLFSIFSSIISSVLVFCLGKRFINKWGGIIAAVFFLFIPFNIYFSRVILPEPMAVMLGLFSLVFFYKFIDSNKFWKLVMSGMFLALGVLVKPFILFYSIPMLYLLISRHDYKGVLKNKELLTKLILFSLIVTFPFILWRFWVSKFPEGIPFWKWALNGDKIRFRPSYWRWIFGERIGHLILGSWALVPFVLGFVKKQKNKFAISFFLGALVYLSLIATANVRHDYYQTLIIPPIALVLAQGSLWMWEQDIFSKNTSRFILLFCLGVGLITGALQVNEFYKINHPEIIVAGEAVDKLTPKDALVIAPYNADTAFLYQTNRMGWPYVDRSIDDLVKKGADYYVSVNYDDDTNKLMNEYETVKKTDVYVILDLNKKVI